MWNIGDLLHQHLSKGKKSSSYREKVMKRIFKLVVIALLLGAGMFATTGCRSLAEEDPNEAQIPWATPADWEGQIPGMGRPGGF
jgi:hypothetical protein